MRSITLLDKTKRKYKDERRKVIIIRRLTDGGNVDDISKKIDKNHDAGAVETRWNGSSCTYIYNDYIHKLILSLYHRRRLFGILSPPIPVYHRRRLFGILSPPIPATKASLYIYTFTITITYINIHLNLFVHIQ